jgi:hypothetical protein
VRLAAVTILIAMSAVAARSGGSQDRPTFRGGVDLVDVDVVATGRNGGPVRDLTAADFDAGGAAGPVRPLD